MKTIETTIYKCDFCGKIYLRKSWCEKHEPKCKKNPDNFQKCMEFCVYLEKKEACFLSETGYDDGNGITMIESESKRDVFYCQKKKHYIYPFWCNNPILQEDIIDEIENEPMPKECVFYDNDLCFDNLFLK